MTCSTCFTRWRDRSEPLGEFGPATCLYADGGLVGFTQRDRYAGDWDAGSCGPTPTCD